MKLLAQGTRRLKTPKYKMMAGLTYRFSSPRQDSGMMDCLGFAAKAGVKAASRETTPLFYYFFITISIKLFARD